MIGHGGVNFGRAQTAGAGHIMQNCPAQSEPAGLDAAAEHLRITPDTHCFIGFGHHRGPLITVIGTQAVIGIRYKTGICRIGQEAVR